MAVTSMLAVPWSHPPGASSRTTLRERIPVPQPVASQAAAWLLEQPTGDADILGCVDHCLQVGGSRRDRVGADRQLAGAVQSGLVVDVLFRGELGVVAALVGAAALLAGERSQQGGLGGQQGGAQVQGVGQVGVPLRGGPDVHLARQLTQLSHAVKATAQPGLVADHPAGRPHGVAQGALQGAGELAAGADEAGQLPLETEFIPLMDRAVMACYRSY
jgi:hypothetical protein